MSVNSEPDDIERITNVQEEDDPDLQNLADENDAVLLSFIGSFGPDYFIKSSMSVGDEFSIEEALTRIANRYESERRKLYLLVNSYGGSPSSSFKISMAIKRFFDDITVFVPHAATSGGAILALTGNRIRMGMMSQLSPVDVQIGQISASSLMVAENEMAERIGTKSGSELSYLEKHLVKSFDPVTMVEMENIVEMGIKYLDRILMAADYPSEKQETIRNELIFGLPTHDFVIQADLAGEMDIAVEMDDTNPEAWKLMRNWLLKYIDKAADTHIVRYVIPNKRKE